MFNEEKRFGAGSVVLSFFIGGLIGAGIALLVAPKSGVETRKQIKEFAEEAKEKAETYIEKVKEKASTAMEKGKEFLAKEKSIIKSAVEAGKEAFEKEKET
ncbi:MAG TPA: YtxH domain-containing protein [Syntrophorhabdaceae bacterium]|nr:YtxH domain-containing protein [Syntrophorhabdaceae bacterium]HPU29045.1 YtxH domain-containing protein [Syntrophorhabdaceae bacterium]